MSLLFTQTKDQAILALVIQEASKVASKKGKYIGRTAVQKLLYFSQIAGIETNYRFEIYHYGPFCEKILRDIDWLIMDGVIEDKSDKPGKYSNYFPSKDINELLLLHQDTISRIQPTVEAVADTLAPLSPTQLELLATLDYVYRQYKASGNIPPLKDQVVNKFKEIKGEKFGQDEVNQMYEVMKKAGIFTE